MVLLNLQSKGGGVSFKNPTHSRFGAGAGTTKKSYCPSVFFPTFLQTAVIDNSVPALFENVGIGNPITATQNRHFTKRCNRRPIAAFFKNAGIGSPKALG